MVADTEASFQSHLLFFPSRCDPGQVNSEGSIQAFDRLPLTSGIDCFKKKTLRYWKFLMHLSCLLHIQNDYGSNLDTKLLFPFFVSKESWDMYRVLTFTTGHF
jgi:hypothetical protein